MNDAQTPRQPGSPSMPGSPGSPDSPESAQLPELSDERIEHIEQALFAQINSEVDQRSTPAFTDTARATRSSRSKRRPWLIAGGVAAAFAAGVLITPTILKAVTPVGIDASAPSWEMTADMAGSPEIGVASDGGGASSVDRDGVSPGFAGDSAAGVSGREVIANGYASVRVEEIAAAADEVAALAETYDGYVENTSIGETMYARDAAMPVPPGGDYGWVSIRVPADSLTDAMAELSNIGEVRSSSVSKHDVTTAAIDLRAHVEATRASVERLTELMSQTGSISELIEAEVALSERQAQLESYEQQLATLEDQVAMSSLQVELTRVVPVTQADPAGFADGLKAGWNGLIVSLNALVIATGFILPWLALAGAAGVVVWLIVRARRRSRY